MTLAELKALVEAMTGGIWSLHWDGTIGRAPLVQTKHGAFDACGGTAKQRGANAKGIAALRNAALALVEVAEAAKYMRKKWHDEFGECDEGCRCANADVSAALARLDAALGGEEGS